MKRIAAFLMATVLLLSLISLVSCKGQEEAPPSLAFSISSRASVFYAGNDVAISITVRNDGGAMPYTGAITDLFSATATAVIGDGDPVMTSLENPVTDDATERVFANGESASVTYTFKTTTETKRGTYTMTFFFNGEKHVFPVAFHLITADV